jgi:hypothetical protein
MAYAQFVSLRFSANTVCQWCLLLSWVGSQRLSVPIHQIPSLLMWQLCSMYAYAEVCCQCVLSVSVVNIWQSWAVDDRVSELSLQAAFRVIQCSIVL